MPAGPPSPCPNSAISSTLRERDPRRPRRENIQGRFAMRQLTEVDRALRQATDARKVAGVVAMAATDKEIIYQGAFGKRELGKAEAMTVDSVFWIASMTKAITATAAMQLVEQGKLKLDNPIGKLLPDLAAPQVLEGFDAAGAPKLRPAKEIGRAHV